MLKEFFAVIGVLTLAAFAFALLFNGLNMLWEFICDKRYEYTYKHRFDKSPTAKCYCIDCKYYDTGYCYFRPEKVTTVGNWFCSNASPKPRERVR